MFIYLLQVFSIWHSHRNTPALPLPGHHPGTLIPNFFVLGNGDMKAENLLAFGPYDTELGPEGLKKACWKWCCSSWADGFASAVENITL